MMGNLSYFHCGDWVENCTALVVDFDGKISLLRLDGGSTKSPITRTFLETGEEERLDLDSLTEFVHVPQGSR